MNQIHKAVRQHLFESLSPHYKCKVGSSYKDCSYIDYSEALELCVDGELLFVLFGAPDCPDCVRLMWSGSPMSFKDILPQPIIPDLAEPDFASFTSQIKNAIANFKMAVVHDDS